MDINEELFAKGDYNKLFERNIPFIKSMFKQYSNIYIEFEEFFSLCSMAFMKTLKHYKPSQGKFLTYWGTAIQHALLNYRRTYERRAKYGLEMISLDTAVGVDGGSTLHDFINEDIDCVDEYMDIHIGEIMLDAFDKLSHTQRRVYDLYIQGISQAEIARRLGMSRQCVGSAVKNGRITLEKELRKSEIYI